MRCPVVVCCPNIEQAPGCVCIRAGEQNAKGDRRIQGSAGDALRVAERVTGNAIGDEAIGSSDAQSKYACFAWHPDGAGRREAGRG